MNFCTVPTGPPLNVTVPAVTSRVMEFTWLPPAPTMRNGRITGYNLTCFITGTGGMGRIGGIYPPQERYILSGFRPARRYTCRVVAMNNVGSGPPAETTAQAPEDGKRIVAILLILSILITPSSLLWQN